MTDEPAEGRVPPEEFEIVEVDCTAYLTDEERKWPVGEGTYPEEEFAIEEPLPVLVLTLPAHSAGGTNGVPAADPARLVAAASEYEVSLGGEGLYPFGPIPPVGPGAVALVPWKADGARDRLEQVGRWAVASAHLAADAQVA